MRSCVMLWLLKPCARYDVDIHNPHLTLLWALPIPYLDHKDCTMWLLTLLNPAAADKTSVMTRTFQV